MNNYNPVRIYANRTHTYTAVHFEDGNKWYIRCDGIGSQTWSADGYDSPREAIAAFGGRVTYTEKPPGASA